MAGYYTFNISIYYDNPFQIQLSGYKYAYRDFDPESYEAWQAEFGFGSLDERLKFELEDYYQGDFFTWSGTYPNLRGPGGGGYSASSYLGQRMVGTNSVDYIDFRGYNPPTDLSISMSFDKDKIKANNNEGVKKVESDIKYIIETAFNNSESYDKEIYLDPVFTRDNRKRASNAPTQSNGSANPRYTPNGKTYSIPQTPDYEFGKSFESERGDDYYITYFLKEIVETPEKPEPEPIVSTQSEPTKNEEGTQSATSSVPEELIRGEYVFNVEKPKTFSHPTLGDLEIVEQVVGGEEAEDTPLFIFDDVEPVTDEDVISDEYLEAEFDGQEELIADIFVREELQNEPLPADTPDKTETLPGEDGSPVDFNDPKFVGGAWKGYNIDSVIAEINKTSHKPNAKFKESLKKILLWIKQDKDITDAREASYLLGTAYAESGYSLQRWEADYVCSGAGIPYGTNGPCQKALNYFRSSKGKKNYYDLGIDSKGFPYFGRGLIQLTGKANYQKYGDKIGVNLVSNGDLALKEENSYKVAVIYLTGRTFKHVRANDLTKARKSVNGGTKGLSEVNGAYNDWLKIFQKSA